MELLVVFGVLIAALLLSIGGDTKKEEKNAGTKAGEQPKKRRLLTEREQAMHNRLVQALPNAVVLAQVSFGALLWAGARPVRNRFDRKIADFVICNRAFQVVALIELDDASHKGKEEKDAERDAMLKDAGYRVIRYPNIPDIEKVRTDFKQLMPDVPQKERLGR